MARKMLALVKEKSRTAGGFGEQLFGQEGMKRLLDDHNAHRKGHTDCLGSLITMERWRKMMQEAHRRARDVVAN